MRRKRKIHWTVQDGSKKGIWWCKGGWRFPCDPPPEASEFEQTRMWFLVNGQPSRVGNNTSNMLHCFTKKSAFRHAAHITNMGGCPILMQWSWRKGKRYTRQYGDWER
jgi:hypothetical protein